MLVEGLDLLLGRWHGHAWRGHRTEEWFVKLEETYKFKTEFTKNIPEPTNTEVRKLAIITGLGQDALTSVTT